MTFPELNKFAVACMRAAMRCGRDHEIAASLPGELQWTGIPSWISNIGLGGLIYRMVERAGLSDRLSSNAREELRKVYYGTLCQNMLLQREMQRVLRALNEQKCDVLIIRGLPLVERAHETLGMRPINDIDLVIAPENMVVAQRCLSDMGYLPDLRHRSILCKNGFNIDLHSDVGNVARIGTRRFAMDIDSQEIFARGVVWREEFAHIRVPSLIDAIVLACLHLQKHGFGRLVWFVDVAGLLCCLRQEGEWDALVERSRQLHLEKPLYYVLRYLADIISLPNARKGLLRLGNIHLSWIERRLLLIVLRGRPLGRLTELLTAGMIERRSDRMRFLAEVVVPKPDVIREATGTFESGACMPYVVRAWQVLRVLCEEGYRFVTSKGFEKRPTPTH